MRETEAAVLDDEIQALVEEADATPITPAKFVSELAEFVSEIGRQDELDYRKAVQDAAVGKMPEKDNLIRLLTATGRTITDFQNHMGMMQSRIEAVQVIERGPSESFREAEKRVAELKRKVDDATDAYNQAMQTDGLAYTKAESDFRVICIIENTAFTNARATLAITRAKGLPEQIAPLQNEHCRLGQQLHPELGIDEPAVEEAQAIKARMVELQAEMAAITKRFDDSLEMNWGRPLPGDPA